MKKVFAYCRVSGKSQVDGDGFPRQRSAIQAFAEARGIEVVRWFEERAITGKSEWEDRPAWMEMVLSLNGVNTIVIESLNRLARDLMVQEHIIKDLRQRGVELISVAEPDLCIDDPSRKLLRQIMGAISEYDRAMIVLKLRGARKRKREATGKCEGPKRYGTHEEEREAVAFMRQLRQQGSTYGTVAAQMNERNFPTRHGTQWHAGTVQKILARESHA